MLLSYNLDYNPLSKYQNMILYIFNFFISFKFLWDIQNTPMAPPDGQVLRNAFQNGNVGKMFVIIT